MSLNCLSYFPISILHLHSHQATLHHFSGGLRTIMSELLHMLHIPNFSFCIVKHANWHQHSTIALSTRISLLPEASRVYLHFQWLKTLQLWSSSCEWCLETWHNKKSNKSIACVCLCVYEPINTTSVNKKQTNPPPKPPCNSSLKGKVEHRCLNWDILLFHDKREKTANMLNWSACSPDFLLLENICWVVKQKAKSGTNIPPSQIS